MSGAVTITGGSGFVGQLLGRGLGAAGYDVRVFDRYRGPLVSLVRRRFLVGSTSSRLRRAESAIRATQVRSEAVLQRIRAILPSGDDICGERRTIAARFAGSRAVIHLAGIPHPHMPGASPEDFWRLNYEASVNVFEAAREAGVPLFIFGSSAQVYNINNLARVSQLPIVESNPLPLPAEGQTVYGFLKGAFERYLAGACATGATQAISLRLECPGVRSRRAENLYISTSIENLIAGFVCALRARPDFGFEAFNLADAEVDRSVVDIQDYISRRWPYVPNRTTGNQCLLSTDKAGAVLGYRPSVGGRYVEATALKAR